MYVGVCVPSSNFLYNCETCLGGACFGKEGGLGGKGGGDLAILAGSERVEGNAESSLVPVSSCAGDSGVGCIRNGFLELALGVTGDVERPLLIEATLEARGGRRRFFLAAASRRLTSLGPSRRSSILFVLGALKNGLEGCGVKGIVKTKGWV